MGRTTVDGRFWAKVDTSGECWTWTGARKQGGYGVTREGYRLVLAHRYAYQSANGPIPDGALVCHRCDNPPCVRPDHLFLGTAEDNAQDRVTKGRSGHHPPVTQRRAPTVLDDATVALIRQRVAAGESQRAVARAFGLHHSAVCLIVNGKRR